MFGVQGLTYVPNYLSAERHQVLVRTIKAQPWHTALSRRTQHYGYVYDYRARKVDLSMHLGKLPSWLYKVAVQLHDDGYFPAVPDQAIINEYNPGQGIADHIDCIPCFSNVIASLSLAAPVIMNFRRSGSDEQIISLWLKPGSLLLLQDEARYQWSHGIARRKYDIVNNQRFKRDRRISITFRKVVV